MDGIVFGVRNADFFRADFLTYTALFEYISSNAYTLYLCSLSLGTVWIGGGNWADRNTPAVASRDVIVTPVKCKTKSQSHSVALVTSSAHVTHPRHRLRSYKPAVRALLADSFNPATVRPRPRSAAAVAASRFQDELQRATQQQRHEPDSGIPLSAFSSSDTVVCNGRRT